MTETVTVQEEMNYMNSTCTVPPNYLYSEYKLLSRGVFDPIKGTHAKTHFVNMMKRYYACAAKRELFMHLYVEREKWDDGHIRIINAARKKAYACFIASMSAHTLKQWYGMQRLVYNTIIIDYNNINHVHHQETYIAMASTVLERKGLTLLRSLLLSAVHYAIDTCVIAYSQEEKLWLMTKKDTAEAKENFWKLCGLYVDPVVGEMYTSLW